MKQVSILGCGWLGLPLAEHLIANGYRIKGSTTTSEKLALLQQRGIEAFEVALGKSENELPSFLEGSQVLILNIPPKVRSNPTENYTDKIRRLIPFIIASGVQNMVFVSSTSVYADDDLVVTENTNPIPESDSGKQILAAEKLLESRPELNVAILRFGGLIGKDRHPINQLSGRQNIMNAEAPVNLIHLGDCIGIISKVITNNVFGEIFNAVFPQHLSRKEYYTTKAQELQLPLPQFSEEISKGKIVSSDKLAAVLDYHFKFQI